MNITAKSILSALSKDEVSTLKASAAKLDSIKTSNNGEEQEWHKNINCTFCGINMSKVKCISKLSDANSICNNCMLLCKPELQ